jgi:hypothetical protein
MLIEPRSGARPISASQVECGRANSGSDLHRPFLSSQCEDLAAPSDFCGVAFIFVLALSFEAEQKFHESIHLSTISKFFL